jgi:hypothetical protein
MSENLLSNLSVHLRKILVLTDLQRVKFLGCNNFTYTSMESFLFYNLIQPVPSWLVVILNLAYFRLVNLCKSSEVD